MGLLPGWSFGTQATTRIGPTSLFATVALFQPSVRCHSRDATAWQFAPYSRSTARSESICTLLRSVANRANEGTARSPLPGEAGDAVHPDRRWGRRGNHAGRAVRRARAGKRG